MEVSDLRERLEGIANGLPRESIENLLMGLVPRVQVATRPVAVDRSGSAVTPRTLDKLKKRVVRTRRAKGISYEVTRPYAYKDMRAGTWRYAMTRSVIASVEDDTGRAPKAQAYLALHWPHYAEHRIDFNWLAKVGIIKLI